MENDYLSIANSNLLFFICLIPIVIVIIQSIMFLRLSRKEAKNLNIPDETIKKVIANSAIFSIVPSLPILITLAILMPVLGKFIPWLRLSVIGSAMYESMAADMTIKSFGLGGLGAAELTPTIFVGIIWVMTLAILVSPVLNVVLLKSYDSKLKSFRKSGGFMAAAVGSLFIGMLAIMGVPTLFNFKNPVGIGVSVISGIVIILFDRIAKATGNKVLSEFSFPLSMVIGMVSAIFLVKLF
jgi:hypothetical protein